MMTGQKVELRPVSLDDFKRTYNWRNDEETARFEAGTGFFRLSNVPMEKIEADYEQSIIKLDKRETGEFSIYTLEEAPEHIGSIGYRELNMIARRCTVGIGVGHKEYWGRGYGTDAMKIMIGFLFKTMNLERIQLDTWSGNMRAIRSYEKCGFQVEGRLRNHSYINGKYYDTIVMGLLREDFQCE
ncbi:GNAT family N-acetyltransferase [Fictibacillus sp. KU28468]|uniref:GNAT family N-acetyltransferase n=1 Tax=Fictibacillus sp. KU28468 TaxID=2991053 RepID=UPI00223D6788|nr:GNAT family protein [Fictibacillus sp. KU28468]UZJ78630.1 GNAT family N-acetyltransferase [Fictibacillus sp. KU28468]